MQINRCNADAIVFRQRLANKKIYIDLLVIPDIVKSLCVEKKRRKGFQAWSNIKKNWHQGVRSTMACSVGAHVETPCTLSGRYENAVLLISLAWERAQTKWIIL